MPEESMTRRDYRYRRADPEAAGVSAGAGARSISGGLAKYLSATDDHRLAIAGIAVAAGNSARRRAVRLRFGSRDLSRRAVAGLAPDLHCKRSRPLLSRQLWMERNLGGRERSLGERTDRLRLSDPGSIYPLSPPPSRSGGNIPAAERHGSMAAT